MRFEAMMELQSLEQLDDVRRANERMQEAERGYSDAERRLEQARKDLRGSEKKGQDATRGPQSSLDDALQGVREAEAALRRAVKELEEARVEHRVTCTRVWTSVESALSEEYRRRVQDAIVRFEQAVQANSRLQEIELVAERLTPPGTLPGRSLLFDVCWNELSKDRFEDWLLFLKQNHILSETERRRGEELPH